MSLAQLNSALGEAENPPSIEVIPLKGQGLAKYDHVVAELLEHLLRQKANDWFVARFAGYVEGLANALEVPDGFRFDCREKRFVRATR